jgi:putative ABC transport system permease protein
MLRNHLTAAFRNVLKRRFFSLIHIGGLAIGLTAGIFVIHFARIEYGLDKFHLDSERIFRVSTARIKDGVEVTRFASTYAGAGPALQADYPEVESYARMFRRTRGGIVSTADGKTRFKELGIFNVDSGFFKVFSFPVLAGLTNDLNAPAAAFVEEKTAQKYFGTSNPIGQRITFGTTEGVEEYEIRGVVSCPENSSIKFTFLLSYHGLTHIFGTEHLSNWNWLDFHTFVKLRKGTNPERMAERFPELMKKFRGDRAFTSKFILQRLPEIYLTSAMEFETGRTGDESTVRILMILGVILLIIVGLNFINLSTAQSFTRAKEVGIRKTLGSSRTNLLLQFLIETAVTNLIAICLCCFLLWIFLPYFNLLTDRSLVFNDFALTTLWQYLLAFFVLGTLVIGGWPALQLSSFKPVEVLKGYLGPKSKGALLRQGFVAFQAFVSFSLVASILIIFDQVKFVGSRELGVHIDSTLVVSTPAVVNNLEEYLSSLDVFESEMLRDARITNITAVADSPGKNVGWVSGTRRVGSPLTESSSMYRNDVDEFFVPALDLTLLAGHNFDKSNTNRDVIVNETARRLLGIESNEAGIGQKILCGTDTMTVIGILKDFHQESPREAIIPTIYQFELETPSWFLIRFEGMDPSNVVRLAQETFSRIYPTDFFDYYFLDEFYDRQYELERKLAAIMMVFCGLAVLVSSLGLLGLTWFTISRRKKELAIRKVVGSSEIQLYRHASGGIFLTTLAGCIAGVPLTTLLMNQWLNNFVLHTSIQPWVFGVALGTSLLVALATVSGYTMKVIRSNPVKHLRAE